MLLFSVSGFGSSQSNTTYTSTIQSLVQRLTSSAGRQSDLNKNISNALATLSDASSNKEPQQGAADRFYQRKEPTIMFGNIQSGFEPDFSDATKVRLQDQCRSATHAFVTPLTLPVVVPPSGNSSLAAGWDTLPTFLNSTIPKLPTEVQQSAHDLCMEFYQLRNSNPVTSAALPQVTPFFHNEDARNETRGRDLWQGTQPWSPLFIEYEAVYYHIPFSKWKLKESPRLSNWGASVLQ